MSKQLVDFEQGTELTGDSNERGNGSDGVDAIKPYDDGEPATASVFDRPIENIRQRSEVLRTEMEAQKYLSDSDMRWIMTKGNADGTAAGASEPFITAWNSVTGIFTVSEPVVVQPSNTPPTDMTEEVDYGFPSGAPTGTLHIEMTRYDYELANIREIHWVPKAAGDITGGVPGFCDFKLSGTDSHILSIWYEELGSATLTDIQTLIGIYGPAGTDVLDPAGFSLSIVGSLAPSILADDFDDYVPPGPLPAHYYAYKTFDRELHYIIPASFSNFFLDPANALVDGDTLAIYFAYFLDPGGTTGRRQRIPGNTNTQVNAVDLFNTRVEPGKIPGCIPLCKRIGDDLLWLDGTFVNSTMSPAGGLHFGEHGYTVERIYGAATTVPITMTSLWYDSTWPGPPGLPWGTIQQALDGIVSDLAGTQNAGVDPVDSSLGTRLIGSPAFSTTPSSLGYHDIGVNGESLKDTIEAVLGLLNSKASLDLGTAGSEETITGRWLFNAPPTMGEDVPFLRAAPSDVSYHLVYRNGGHSETNDDVSWDTYSVYEIADGGQTVATFCVFGGYLSSDGMTVTAPSSGGPGLIQVIMWGKPFYYLMATKDDVADSATQNPYLYTDWDSWDIWAEVGGGTQHVMSGSNRLTSVQAGFDFAASSHSYIKVASQPYTKVIDGFYALGPSNTDPFGAFGTWTANRMLVSSGRAVVNGIPINKTGTSYLVLSSSTTWMDDIVSLPTDDTVADDPITDTPGIPGWYYLWLRSDGNFFIGKAPPHGDYATSGHYPGTILYRPSAGAHTGSLNPRGVAYSAADYVLCDVIALVHYDAGPNWYWDNAPCVGGDLRRLRHRVHATTLLWTVDDASGVSVAGNISLCYNDGTFSNRSPGIPLGVTSRARLLCEIVGEAPTVGGGVVTYKLSHVDTANPSIHPKKSTNPIYQRVWYPIDPTGGAYSYNFINVDELDIYVENRETATRGMIHRETQVIGVGASLTTASLQLVGFYWDRDAGGSYWRG